MIAQDNETSADLASLVKNHQAMVWRYLRALGCDAATADDLTQETFLKLVRRPMEYRGEAAAAVYLRKVARSRFISRMRKAGRAPNQVDLELVDQHWAKLTNDANADQGEEALAALKRCLQRLPEQARRAIELRYEAKQSRQASADELEMTPDGVKSLLRRARKALRTCVEQQVSVTGAIGLTNYANEQENHA